MSLNNQCPKCNRYGILTTEHELHEEALVVCRECPHCQHKWLEVYELDVIHSERPLNEKESANGAEQ